MKRHRKIMLLLAVVAAVFSACLFGTDIFLRAYPKDRINGTYTVTLNSKQIPYCMRYTSDFQPPEQDCGQDGTAGIKGGEHGCYTIIFSPKDNTEEEPPAVKLEIFNTNWWNLIDFELNCDIKSVGQEYRVNTNLTYSYYSADMVSKRETKTIHQSDKIGKTEVVSLRFEA